MTICSVNRQKSSKQSKIKVILHAQIPQVDQEDNEEVTDVSADPKKSRVEEIVFANVTQIEQPKCLNDVQVEACLNFEHSQIVHGLVKQSSDECEILIVPADIESLEQEEVIV